MKVEGIGVTSVTGELLKIHMPGEVRRGWGGGRRGREEEEKSSAVLHVLSPQEGSVKVFNRLRI